MTSGTPVDTDSGLEVIAVRLIEWELIRNLDAILSIRLRFLRYFHIKQHPAPSMTRGGPPMFPVIPKLRFHSSTLAGSWLGQCDGPLKSGGVEAAAGEDIWRGLGEDQPAGQAR
jgi:hypothetical protein